MASRAVQDISTTNKHSKRSKTDHEVVCVGFGSSSIALAIALHEIAPDVNVLFLERQTQSEYIPFSRSPGIYMQHSFLNDLVTYENPRSRFSYLSYLRATDQLIKFTNLGSIRPLREQFGRYLSWCAGQFEHQVQYGSEVQAIRPSQDNRTGHKGTIQAWDVEFVDVQDDVRRIVSTKQVICAVGLQPKIPVPLENPAISLSVLCPTALRGFLANVAVRFQSQHHLVVVGDGLEAAEATEAAYSIHSPFLKVSWLRTRNQANPQVIESGLDARLSEYQYAQQIREKDPRKRRLQIHDVAELKSANRNGSGKLRLVCAKYEHSAQEIITDCDFVVSAIGYTTSEHERLLNPLKSLLYKDEFFVDGYNGLKFKPGLIEDDCGIWLLGSLRSKNEIYDGLMTHVASQSRALAAALLRRLDVLATDWEQLDQPRRSSDHYRFQKARL